MCNKAIKKKESTHQICNELNCVLLIYTNTPESVHNNSATCLGVASLTARTKPLNKNTFRGKEVKYYQTVLLCGPKGQGDYVLTTLDTFGS